LAGRPSAWRRRLRPLTSVLCLLTSVLCLLASVLLVPSARAYEWQNSGIWESALAERGFDSGRSWFSAGPAWLMNAMPGSNFRARNYVIDSDGDLEESTTQYNGYVGTLHDVFDVNLFNNVATFGAASGPSKVATPRAMDALGTPRDFTTGTSMLTPGNYNPSGLPDNTIDVRLNRAGATLTITSSTLSMESLNVDDGNTFTTNNGASSGGSDSTLNLGNIAGFTNSFSNVDNDLVYLTASSTLTIANGASKLLNVGLASSGNFSIGTGSALTISSAISGSGKSITKTGVGVLTLSGANTFSGGFTLSSGTIALGISSTATTTVTNGPTGTGTLTLNGGTFRSTATTGAGGDRTINNNLSLSGSITLGDGTNTGVLTFDNTGLTTKSAALAADTTLTTSSAVIIADALSGDFNLTKAGGSTLTLNGNNTFGSGKTFTLSAGTLNINSAIALGAGTFEIDGGVIDSTAAFTNQTLTNNNTLRLNGDFAFTGTNSLNLGTGAVTLGPGAGTTRTITVSANTLTIGGDISNGTTANTIIKAGNGTLTLTGNNSYSGGTHLTAGTIAVGSDTALGGGTLAFSDGATLRSADASTRTLGNVWTPGNGTSNTIFGSSTTGDLILTDATSFSLGTSIKTFTINNGNTTLAKVFTNVSTSNGITKTGAGRLLLTGSSTYTGVTTIDAGTLNAAIIANGGTASSIGQSSNLAARVVFGGGTLQYTGSTAASTDRLFTIGNANANTATVDASGVSVGTLSFTSGGSIAFGNTNAHTLTLTGSNTGNNTFSPTIGDNSGATNVVKDGGGTWVLSGNNSYSGGTTLSNGLLQLNNNNALGSSSGQLTVNGGVLNLNDHSISVGNLTGSGGTIWNNIASNAVTLTIGNGNAGGGNYAGVIADRNVGGGTGTGTVALTKTGNGTITLSGTNTYTGATTINGGTLLVTGSTASGSAVTINNSGTLGGTGIVSGTVQVNSGGTLSPGTSPGTLTTGAVTLANGSIFAVDLTAASGNDLLVAPSVTLGTLVTGPSLSLNITGTLSMGQQFFIVDNTGANAVSGVFAQGATITSGQYTFLIDYLADFGTSSATGGNDIMLQVTAIPETSTWVIAALALGAIGVMGRRRFKKKSETLKS
jgi:fibronectin-binding autotransporter adhesin